MALPALNVKLPGFRVPETGPLLSLRERTGFVTFSDLYRHHNRGVRNYVLRYVQGNGADADDVTSETFFRVMRYITSFQPGRDFGGWLYTIARNTALSYRQRQQRYYFDTVTLDHYAAESRGGEEIWGESSGLETKIDVPDKVRRLIEHVLPDDFKEVLYLRSFGGLSYQEIAEATGKPLGTVMSQLYRARQRLAPYKSDFL